MRYARSGNPWRGGRAARLALVGVGLACAATNGGCHHAPRQSANSVLSPPAAPGTAPPTASGDPVPTVSVDLNRSVGENTTFHKTATDRQRFQVHVDFGKVFEAQGLPDRALEEYKEALKVAEDRGRGELNAADEALAHRRIATTFDRLGQFRQSEPHYQKAMKLAAKDPKVWNDAGYSYYLQGRWADAERSLRTAMKLDPNDARIRTNLGMVLGASGKTEEALTLLSANQGDALGHANLGYLLASTGQYGPARQEYQAALSMRPDLPLARRALAQLDRQERGLAAQPVAAIASINRPAKLSEPGKLDPEVMRTSAPIVTIPPPPPPPLP